MSKNSQLILNEYFWNFKDRDVSRTDISCDVSLYRAFLMSSSSTWPSQYFLFKFWTSEYEHLIRIWTLNLNKCNLFWQITVCDYCHYGCPGVLDSQNLWHTSVCSKGAFGIRRERLRNSLNVYPAEKKGRVHGVYLFRNPARNIKQASSKQKWKGLSKHGTPKYMCYIHKNLTVAQLPPPPPHTPHTHTHTHTHTAVDQRWPNIRSPSTSRSRPLFLVAINIYLPPQYDNYTFVWQHFLDQPTSGKTFSHRWL